MESEEVELAVGKMKSIGERLDGKYHVGQKVCSGFAVR